MKRIRTAFYLLSAVVATLSGCKTETTPRPLADINLLAGKWIASVGNEIEINPTTRQGILTKVRPFDNFGSKVGDVYIKNIVPVDEKTFRGETRYYGSAGFYLYNDVTIMVKGDVLETVAMIGSLGSISVSGQKGEYNRVK